MNSISQNVTAIQKRIQMAVHQFHRAPESVALLAVSKKRSVSEVMQAIQAGQYIFGENYVQEAIPKIEALSVHQLEWHFIGPIQSNKTSLIARYFSWVHGVSRFKIAERLNHQRPKTLAPLNVCIEVNIDQEVGKAGVFFKDVLPLAEEIRGMPRLKLRGLMAIPALKPDFDAQRKSFKLLADKLHELNQHGFELDTLSMGMSSDFDAAIAEGATIVRIGTAIFGPRMITIKK